MFVRVCLLTTGFNMFLEEKNVKVIHYIKVNEIWKKLHLKSKI
jgi:hypothetical protein